MLSLFCIGVLGGVFAAFLFRYHTTGLAVFGFLFAFPALFIRLATSHHVGVMGHESIQREKRATYRWVSVLGIQLTELMVFLSNFGVPDLTGYMGKCF